MRIAPRPSPRLLAYAIGIASIPLGYMLLGLAAGERIFPPLVKLLSAFASMLASGELATHVGASLARLGVGIGLALVMGIPLAFALARSRLLDASLRPLLYFAHPIPKVTFLPVLLLAFGVGDAPKAALVFLIAVFPLVTTIRDRLKALEPETAYPVLAAGGGKLAALIHCTLPQILPDLISSLRVAGGTGFAVRFIAESFATDHGLGSLVLQSWNAFDFDRMQAAILALSLAGFLWFAAMDLLERLLCPWRFRRRAERS